MNADAPLDLSSRQLRAVMAVAEYRSFIAAASFLEIPQPALCATVSGSPSFPPANAHPRPIDA
jgi:hypothetical protein